MKCCFVLHFHMNINAYVLAVTKYLLPVCMPLQSEDESRYIELYQTLQDSTSTIPFIWCLYYRHNAYFTQHHIYSLSLKIISR